ncbi:MAG: hypothetical protein RUMPE_00524 [Eubacteriales bacterium SKADARSKE-1]|nr:hypothetical protein [Eubacteriales bacterium SKADARSKE-1]
MIRKLTLSELNMIYGGVFIGVSVTPHGSYLVALLDDNKNEIASVKVHDNPDWQENAAWYLCAQCWGNGTNYEIYNTIDKWVGIPNFCATSKQLVDLSIKDRLIANLGE